MSHPDKFTRPYIEAAVRIRIDLRECDLTLNQSRLIRAADILRHERDFSLRPITQLAELALLCELRQQLGLPVHFR